MSKLNPFTKNYKLIYQNYRLRLFKKYVSVFHDRELNAPTDKEVKLIKEFRDKISEVEKIETKAVDAWQLHRKELRSKIINQSPRDFIRWDMMRSIFWDHAHKIEFEYLRSKENWNYLQKVLVEDTIGRPYPYLHFPKTSSNLLHHLYTIEFVKESFGVDITKLNSVLEFGGGYGSFCRLMYKLNYQGKYTIYDLPEFSLLQEYFLKNIDLPTSLHKDDGYEVNLITDQKYIVGPYDLFIGLWSISEVPFELREEIFKKIDGTKYILIGFQGEIFGNDNTPYFTDLVNRMDHYNWKKVPIKHLPFKDEYLFGELKS